MGKRARRYGLIGLGIAAAIACVSFLRPGELRSSARREWKDGAIRTIRERVADAGWLRAQRGRVGQERVEGLQLGGWFSDELLLMKNGEWIAARSICRKEPPGIHDLFVGQGSDGKWYYSTFHFCIGKMVLNGEPQPASLAEFVHGYWLEPFDGESDKCLRVTWDGGAFGVGRN